MKKEDLHDENSIDLDFKYVEKVYPRRKMERDFYLNVVADLGFDLNKFPNEDEDVFKEKISGKRSSLCWRYIYQISLKIYDSPSISSFFFPSSSSLFQCALSVYFCFHCFFFQLIIFKCVFLACTLHIELMFFFFSFFPLFCSVLSVPQSNPQI